MLVLAERLEYVTLLLRVRGNTAVEQQALLRRRIFDAKVTELVKANKRFEDTRVVLYSSRSHDELKSDVARCGADGFVQKTGKTVDLVTAVDKLLSS